MINTLCRRETTTTLEYYNVNAHKFADSTAHVEFSAIQAKFASLLRPGTQVLDFGCGSGRDTKRFLEEGFSVTAIDGSKELCKIASKLTGIEVRNELFQDLNEENTYDGIWACSSILHLTKQELAEVFLRMVKALKQHGVIYTSFKYGSFEGLRNGRYFTDFTLPLFAAFLESIPALTIEEYWISDDVRPGRENEKWLNLILRKI